PGAWREVVVGVACSFAAWAPRAFARCSASSTSRTVRAPSARDAPFIRMMARSATPKRSGFDSREEHQPGPPPRSHAPINCTRLEMIERRTKWLGTFGAALCALSVPSLASAAECPTNLENVIYGSGGSAVTATMRQVAAALAGLPGDQKITVLWHDPGACIGFGHFVNGTIPGSTTRNVIYWDAAGVATTCQAPTSTGLPVDFAHMGNTAD